MGVKDKLKKAAGAGLVIAATGGTGAAAATAMMVKMEKTKYNIDSWGPLGSDPKLIQLKYGPPSAFDTADKLTISGTPFDGKYGVVKGRTRREAWIRPAKPITESGSGGQIRVKTSVAARLRHLHSASLAKTRDTGKAAGRAVKKAGGFLWDKIKKGLMILFALMILYLVVTTVIKAKVTQAVTPAPVAPAPVAVA